MTTILCLLCTGPVLATPDSITTGGSEGEDRAEPGLELDAGAHEELIAEALEAELPGALGAGGGRALLVRVRETDAGLAVSIFGEGGEVVLERLLPLDDGMVPALRNVVLLVRRALVLEREPAAAVAPAPPLDDTPPAGEEAGAPAEGPEATPAAPEELVERRGGLPPLVPPTPASTPAAPEELVERRGRPLEVVASVAGLAWRGPLSPRIGPSLSMGLRPPGSRRLTLGGWVALPGLVCCDPSSSAIDAKAREVLVSAQVAVTLAEWDRVVARALVGGGAGWIAVDAAPSVFAGEVVPVRISFGQAVGLLALAADASMSESVALRFELGLLARLGAHRVRLPEAWAEEDDPLETGWASPWLSAGIRRSFF